MGWDKIADGMSGAIKPEKLPSSFQIIQDLQDKATEAVAVYDLYLSAKAEFEKVREELKEEMIAQGVSEIKCLGRDPITLKTTKSGKKATKTALKSVLGEDKAAELWKALPTGAPKSRLVIPKKPDVEPDEPAD